MVRRRDAGGVTRAGVRVGERDMGGLELAKAGKEDVDAHDKDVLHRVRRFARPLSLHA